MNDIMIRVHDERGRAEPFDELKMPLPPRKMVRGPGERRLESQNWAPGRRSFRPSGPGDDRFFEGMPARSQRQRGRSLRDWESLARQGTRGIQPVFLIDHREP